MLKDKLKGKTYIAYSRCSTEEQQKHGNSHEYQMREIRGFASRNGMDCLGEFQDTITGTSFNSRPELDKAVRLCERLHGQVDYLLVYKQDRFGRDPMGALMVTQKFRELNVEINFTDEWVDYGDSSHPMMLLMKYAMAQTESLKISERTKDGLYQRQLEGYHTGNAPVGYIRVPLESVNGNGKRGTICVPDSERAKIIVACFEQLSSGTISQAELFKKYGDHLGVSRSTFYKIFKNLFYTGRLYIKAYKDYSARIVDGKHEPIISKELFAQVQSVISDTRQPNFGRTWTTNNRKMDSDYYLKGVLKCPHSGSMMTAYRVKKGKYHYYSTPKGKNRIIIPVKLAHSIARKAIAELTLPEETYIVMMQELDKLHLKSTKEMTKRSKMFSGELKTISGRQMKIDNDYADGKIDVKTFSRLCDNLTKRTAEIEVELMRVEELLKEGLSFKSRVLNLLKDVVTIYDNCSIKEKNQLLRVLFPDGFTIDKESGKVLTKEVNEYLVANDWLTSSYETIEIKKDQQQSTGPVKGGRRDLNPRPLEPQSSALTN